ncbi:MAG: hypothetical protein HY521_06620 [Proteobacteria bacterium]|nr:hypothetical protein [Pseudomonadota bacterium]
MAGTNAPSRKELRRLAAELGLERAAADHFDDLRRAFESSRGMVAGLGRDLAPAEEPAHRFAAGKGEGGR